VCFQCSAELKEMLEGAAEKGDIVALSQYDDVCAKYSALASYNHDRSRDRRIRELWSRVADEERRALLLEVIKPLHEDELRVRSPTHRHRPRVPSAPQSTNMRRRPYAARLLCLAWSL
jgi:hypothetical protein